MAVQNIKQEAYDNTVVKPAMSLEYRRVIYQALRYWYLIVFSGLLGLTVAFLMNRYTTRIFPNTASIIIREVEERADGRFLYNNPLANPSRNYFNEIFIIKSYPLVRRVVEDLNFNVVVQKEGTIKTSEQYNNLPFAVRVVGPLDVNGAFEIEINSQKDFYFQQLGKENRQLYKFGDTVSVGRVHLLVSNVGDQYSMSEIKGDKYIVRVLDPQTVAGSYIGRMKVNWSQQGASVVDLSIDGPNPQKELDFLNQLVLRYQQYDLEKKNMAADRSIDFINEQLQSIGDSLGYFEQELQSFKQANKVTDLSGENLRLYQQMELLQKEKAEFRVAETYYTYIEEYLKNGRNLEQMVLPSSLNIKDPIINDLILKFTTAQAEVMAMRSEGVENPLVTAREKRITQMRASIGESINSLRQTDAIKLKFIDQELQKVTKQIGQLPESERMLVNIRRNYTLSESIYVFLMEKRAEAGISKASNTSDVILVNPPRTGSATTPKVLQNYIVGGLVGLLIPFIVFYLIELSNTRVQSREDIETTTGIPIIGGIGHKTTAGNLVVSQRPKSALAESFRALRSSLNYFTQGKDKKVFLIMSSLSGEGKTFTTINLATVFALSGKKTMIIGADLRKPKIYGDFGLTNTVGLSTYLSGMVEWENIIQQTSLDNLDIISGGPVPPNPSELMMNERLAILIDALKSRYDFILVDTPPVALVTDAFVLSQYADHCIFIVRQGYTPKEMLNALEDHSTSGKLRQLSIVLNDIQRSGPGYGYHGYGGYSYGYNYGYGYRYNGYGDGSYYDEGESNGRGLGRLFGKLKSKKVSNSSDS